MSLSPRDGKPVSLFHLQHELIAGRTAQAWYRIMSAGPAFHLRWSYGSSGDGKAFHELVDGHPETAVCREEPALTVAWGMSSDRTGAAPADPGWAQELVDHTVRGIWADFFWCGALIDRVELARINGAHGLIPFPRPRDTGRTVTDFEVAVAWLLHDLEGGQEEDNPGRYLSRLDIATVYDQAREGAGTHR